ncbi:MAG: hypothetical protein IT371_01815 [Deltaproteobacteria bacterium]|nr:hypothetical protein [Deltaproteobacteria bacterium]
MTGVAGLRLLGERRAVSLLLLGFYTSVFVVLALAQGGPWLRCFLALAATYGLAFFGLAAEWFWARWFAMGLAMSGVTTALLGFVTVGWNVGLAIWGGMHLLIYAPLLGRGMADRYENQSAWRARYGLDDHGVARIKRAVNGAATALPTMIFYTLAPRQDQALAALLLAGAAVGLFGLVRLRVWGLALLATTALGLLFVSAAPVSLLSLPFSGALVPVLGLRELAFVALAFAVIPFAGPAYRYLRAA